MPKQALFGLNLVDSSVLIFAQIVVFPDRFRPPVARSDRYKSVRDVFALLACLCVQVILMNRDEQLFMSAMAAYSRGEKIIE